jgi:hypothetical protein
MDSETSRLRRGAIRLGDVEEETLVSSKSPARKPWIKIALYSLAICASIIGLGSLLRAIIVIDNYDWADNAWPFFHHVFVDQYRPVIGLVRYLNSAIRFFTANSSILALDVDLLGSAQPAQSPQAARDIAGHLQ